MVGSQDWDNGEASQDELQSSFSLQGLLSVGRCGQVQDLPQLLAWKRSSASRLNLRGSKAISTVDSRPERTVVGFSILTLLAARRTSYRWTAIGPSLGVKGLPPASLTDTQALCWTWPQGEANQRQEPIKGSESRGPLKSADCLAWPDPPHSLPGFLPPLLPASHLCLRMDERVRGKC